jgi:hypothetical protein
MNTAKTVRKNKHFILNQHKLDRAKKLLGTATETETIELALDRIISEAEANKKAWNSHKKFMRELIEGKHQIIDVYGNLE